MPSSSQTFLKLTEVNFLPRSVRNTRIFFPHSYSARAWIHLIASAASLFACSRTNHMKWLLSSTSRRKMGLAAWGRRLDGPTDIAVHELQQLTGAIGYLRQKGGAPLLANETPVTACSCLRLPANRAPSPPCVVFFVEHESSGARTLRATSKVLLRSWPRG